MVRGFGCRGLGLLLLAWALAAAMAGCGGGGGDSSDETVAFLLPSEPTIRYLGQPGFGEKVDELCRQCKVLYGNARGSAARQQAQAKQMLEEGADVLVLDPVDSGAASQIVQEARSADVPVIAYVHQVSKADYFVGVNSEALGGLQADAVLASLEQQKKPSGPIVVMTSGSGGPQGRGALAELHSAGLKIAREYEIEEEASPARAFALAKRDMGSAIGALGPNGFVAVLTPDDETAAGAIAAMKAAGIDPAQKPTTGAGASLAAVKRILVGEQYLSAYEANWQVRAYAARLAARLAEGKPVPASWITEKVDGVPAMLLQATAVDAKNLMSTVIPYGFTKPRQLCVGRYARYCAEAKRPIHRLR